MLKTPMRFVFGSCVPGEAEPFSTRCRGARRPEIVVIGDEPAESRSRGIGGTNVGPNELGARRVVYIRGLVVVDLIEVPLEVERGVKVGLLEVGKDQGLRGGPRKLRDIVDRRGAERGW